MLSQSYKVFRILAFMCLVIAVGLAVAFYFKVITAELFGILSGLAAILVSLFGIFASKPVGKEDVSVAIDKVLTTYDKDTIERLKNAKDEERQIKDFIEHRSNEVFLLKLREYLRQDIEQKYQASDIAKLMGELEQVESKLDTMNVQYSSVELPDRFKKVLNELNEREQFELMMDMIDAFPFMPFKELYKATLRAYYVRKRRKVWS